MDVKIIDSVPDDKQHCGNCSEWVNRGELFGFCKTQDKDCPSFGLCGKWK